MRVKRRRLANFRGRLGYVLLTGLSISTLTFFGMSLRQTLSYVTRQKDRRTVGDSSAADLSTETPAAFPSPAALTGFCSSAVVLCSPQFRMILKEVVESKRMNPFIVVVPMVCVTTVLGYTLDRFVYQKFLQTLPYFEIHSTLSDDIASTLNFIASSHYLPIRKLTPTEIKDMKALNAKQSKLDADYVLWRNSQSEKDLETFDQRHSIPNRSS